MPLEQKPLYLQMQMPLLQPLQPHLPQLLLQHLQQPLQPLQYLLPLSLHQLLLWLWPQLHS